MAPGFLRTSSMNSAIVFAAICEFTSSPAGLLAIAVIGVKSFATSNEEVWFWTRSTVCDSESTTPIVWPSAAARLSMVMPMAPDAPGWFSTTTGWRNTSVNFVATRRALISPAPPGGLGTMILMVFEGKSCAAADSEMTARAQASNVALSQRLSILISRVFGLESKACRQLDQAIIGWIGRWQFVNTKPLQIREHSNLFGL